MYSSGTGNATTLNPINDAPPTRPTLATTHEMAIRNLSEAIEALNVLLSKLRGSQPAESRKEVEEMPSVMTAAGKINLLSNTILQQLREVTTVIGD